MRICLDLRDRKSGTAAVYADHLVPGLLRLGRAHTFFAIKRPGDPVLPRGFAAVASAPESDSFDLAWTGVRLPSLLREWGIDVYHGLGGPGPLHTACAVVHTVHDVLEDRRANVPESAAARAFLRIYEKPSLRRADRLIAPSEFMRDHLARVLLIDRDRVAVIPHGIDDRFRPRPEADVRRTTDRYGLRRYLLSVGTISRLKNQVTAIRAFARLAAGHPGLELVFAGELSDDYMAIAREEARRLDVAHRVKFLGFVPFEDLPDLMNGAVALLSTSLGDGCPVALVEAMSCGTPVIAARVAGLAEFGRDAAAFVADPFDDAEFAAAARRWLDDAGERERAGRRSLGAAAGFSWDASVRAHLAVYDACVADRAAPVPVHVA